MMTGRRTCCVGSSVVSEDGTPDWVHFLNGVLGFVHSPIHFGYALEFDQPLIMAEALALTAVHDCHFGEVLTAIEAAANSSNGSESLINLQR